MKLPHMPLWVYDIESDEDCRRMGDADFGRYMRLLIRQWIEGSVPSAVADVVRIAMLDSGSESSVQNLLEKKFKDAGDGRRLNKRCDDERREILAKIETNRRNGKRRHRQRPLSDRSSELTATAIATAPANTQQHAYESEYVSDSGSSPDLSSLPSAIYAAYPRHVGPRKAMAEIAGALNRIGNGEAKKPPDIPEWPPPNPAAWLLDRTKQYAEATAGWHVDERQYIPHPSTFFHQDRYCDDPKQWQRNIGTGGSRQTAGSGTTRAPASTAASRGEFAGDLGEARRL